MELIKKFIKEESAATVIEYGLIAALISVAAIGALEVLGNGISSSFSLIGNEANAGNDGINPPPAPPPRIAIAPPASVYVGP